jgi:hypothetical protein
MTPRTELILKALAEHHGLEIEHVDDLPDKVAGFLQSGSDPRYIFVNARKSPSEQVFTIAHELAHYIMHLDRKPWVIRPWYLKIKWKAPLAVRISRTLTRLVRIHYGPEFQADLWAYVILWQIGARDDLLAITEMYPKKNSLFWLSSWGVIYGGLKRLIKSLFQRMFNPSPAQ